MYNKSLTYIFYINLSKWVRNKWFGDRHYCFLLNIFFYQGLTLLKPVVQSMSLSPSHKARESRMLSCPWVSCYKHNNNRLKSWFGFKIFFCTCIFKAVEFILFFKSGHFCLQKHGQKIQNDGSLRNKIGDPSFL